MQKNLRSLILPIRLREVVGAYAADMLNTQCGREIERVQPGIVHLRRNPLLPTGIAQAVDGLMPPLPCSYQLALEHTLLRYYVPFTASHLANLMVRAVISGDDVAGRWRLSGAIRIGKANKAAPVVCIECIRLAQKRKELPFWSIEMATFGYEYCAVHHRPMWHCCERCAQRTESWKFYSSMPTIACHCGGQRRINELAVKEEIAIGVAEDIALLFEGALDGYYAEDVREGLRHIADKRNLLGLPEKTRRLMVDSGASRFLNALGGPTISSEDLLRRVVEGRQPTMTPIVALTCIRALCGSLRIFVSLLKSIRHGVSAEKPSLIAEETADIDRLEAGKRLIENVIRRGCIESKQDLQAAFSQEMSFVICYAERDIEAMLVNRGGATNRLRSAGRPRYYSDEVAVELVRANVRAITSDLLHDRLCMSLLLGDENLYDVYIRDKDRFPRLTELLNELCEDMRAFRRRVYRVYIKRYPREVQPGMPTISRDIDLLSGERLAALLSQLGVSLSHGHVARKV